MEYGREENMTAIPRFNLRQRVWVLNEDGPENLAVKFRISEIKVVKDWEGHILTWKYSGHHFQHYYNQDQVFSKRHHAIRQHIKEKKKYHQDQLDYLNGPFVITTCLPATKIAQLKAEQRSKLSELDNGNLIK